MNFVLESMLLLIVGNAVAIGVGLLIGSILLNLKV